MGLRVLRQLLRRRYLMNDLQCDYSKNAQSMAAGFGMADFEESDDTVCNVERFRAFCNMR